MGRHCERLLRSDDGLDPIVVATESPTRVILTLRTEATSEQTAFFDPNPAVSLKEGEALAACVLREPACGAHRRRFACRVRVPPQATHSLYSDLIAMAQRTVFRFFSIPMDPHSRRSGASGRPSFNSIAARLLSTFANPRLPIVTWLLCSTNGVGEEWFAAMVTDGPNPVTIVHRGKSYRAVPPRIEAGQPDRIRRLLARRAGRRLAERPRGRAARRAMPSPVLWPMHWSGMQERLRPPRSCDGEIRWSSSLCRDEAVSSRRIRSLKSSVIHCLWRNSRFFGLLRRLGVL